MNVENWPVNPGDVAVIVILLVSALLAFARGFVREVLSIAGWIGAAVVTYYLFDYAQPFLLKYPVIPEPVANIITGAVIFIIALIVFSTIAHVIARAVRGTSLSAVDRSLGFLFGVVRGAILVCLAYLLLIWAQPEGEEAQWTWISEAKSQPMVAQGADFLKSLVPADTLERLFPNLATPTDTATTPGVDPLAPPQPQNPKPTGQSVPAYDSTDLNQAVEGTP